MIRKRYNEIQLTKNKMDLKNYPQFPVIVVLKMALNEMIKNKIQLRASFLWSRQY